MSLAQLFYAKQEQRTRILGIPFRRRRPAARPRRKRLLLEPMEPRVLLSADPLLKSLEDGLLKLTFDLDIVVAHVADALGGGEVLRVTSGTWAETYGSPMDAGVTEIELSTLAGNDTITLNGVKSKGLVDAGGAQSGIIHLDAGE